MAAYTEPLHVILDGLRELEASIVQGGRPWDDYESAFDNDGMFSGPEKFEYMRAIAIARVQVVKMIERNQELSA